VTASADPTGNSDALLYTMIPDIDQLKTILAAQKSETVTIAFRGVSQHVGDKTSSVPNATGRWINLSPCESDEIGVPRAWVQMATSSSEDNLANAMDSAIQVLATQLAGGDASKVNVISRDRDGIGTTYHGVGTLWMGTDPSTSVADTNGRFQNVSNAFCSDQLLFVTVGSMNPTLTALVLTRRVAEAAVALATS
jgi:choline dehydrogenase-like flavoprotein